MALTPAERDAVLALDVDAPEPSREAVDRVTVALVGVDRRLAESTENVA